MFHGAVPAGLAAIKTRAPADSADGRLRSAAERAAKTNRTGLPDALKSGVESLSGMSLDHVRVHRNSAKPSQLNAHAYAQGTDIHLAPGQEKHLPHEAWHIVQQAQGCRTTYRNQPDDILKPAEEPGIFGASLV